MSLFANVIDTPHLAPPKGIVYGPPGIGKTTFGANADGAIIIDCENGAGAVRCKRAPYLPTWPEMQRWLYSLETEEHPFKVVVIDSVDWMLRRIEEHVTRIGSKDAEKKDMSGTLSRSHGGFGNGKQVLKNHVYELLLPRLDRIVVRGVAVILLGHARRFDVTDVDGITTEKTAPDLPDGYMNIFVEWADFVCLARMEADGTRSLVTQETSRALAKNRYSLPPTIPFSWNALVGAMMAGQPATA